MEDRFLCKIFHTRRKALHKEKAGFFEESDFSAKNYTNSASLTSTTASRAGSVSVSDCSRT
jgi:hypothetical protein